MARPITRRLRRLAELHPERGKVLSVFFNLDPSEFATPPARATEINSVLTAAAHKVEEVDGARPRGADGAAGRRRARARGARGLRRRHERHARGRGLRLRAGRRARGRAARTSDRVARRRRRPRVRRAARPRARRGSLVRAARQPPRGADPHRHRRGPGGGGPVRERHARPARPGWLVAVPLPALGRAGEAHATSTARWTRCSPCSSATRSTGWSSARRRSSSTRSRSGCTRT